MLAAELIAKGLPSLPVLALSLITPIFISMASFAINDYFDMEVDRVNRKNRPLVTGELRPVDALYVTSASLIIGIAASFLINMYAFAIAVIFAALAMLYSYRLKGIALVGNSYIAFSMAVPFIYGSYVVGTGIGEGVALVAAMIFLSGLAREIHGTVRDLSGDRRARGLRTLPGIIGKTASSAVGLLLYLAAIAISVYLFLGVSPFRHNPVYGGLVGISDAALLYIGIGYLAVRRQGFYDMSRNVSLAAMALALLAILLAPV